MAEIVDETGMVFDWNPEIRNFGITREQFQSDVLRKEDSNISLARLKSTINFELEDADERIERKFNAIIGKLLPAEVKIFLGLTHEEKEYFIQTRGATTF
ncbi:MAG: hypothetical protein WC788_02005 [Candidatus Paceibacterota bacterium]|jgi:hypothetical protein